MLSRDRWVEERGARGRQTNWKMWRNLEIGISEVRWRWAVVKWQTAQEDEPAGQSKHEPQIRQIVRHFPTSLITDREVPLQSL
jgi:hypothetical protein